MKNLKTLAKQLDFKNDADYFEYCIESYINGNFQQCKKLFKDMHKKDRVSLLRYIDETADRNTYKFYAELN